MSNCCTSAGPTTFHLGGKSQRFPRKFDTRNPSTRTMVRALWTVLAPRSATTALSSPAKRLRTKKFGAYFIRSSTLSALTASNCSAPKDTARPRGTTVIGASRWPTTRTVCSSVEASEGSSRSAGTTDGAATTKVAAIDGRNGDMEHSQAQGLTGSLDPDGSSNDGGHQKTRTRVRPGKGGRAREAEEPREAAAGHQHRRRRAPASGTRR